MFRGLGNRPPDLVFVTDVGRRRDGRLAEVASQPADPVGAPGQQRDTGARSDACRGRRGADSRRSARDEDPATRQCVHSHTPRRS